MPYIEKKLREEVDPKIDALSQTLESHEYEPGMLNYSISKILWKMFRSKPRYVSVVIVMGTLVSVALEFYRRLASPYEDQKRDINGDL